MRLDPVAGDDRGRLERARRRGAQDVLDDVVRSRRRTAGAAACARGCRPTADQHGRAGGKDQRGGRVAVRRAPCPRRTRSGSRPTRRRGARARSAPRRACRSRTPATQPRARAPRSEHGRPSPAVPSAGRRAGRSRSCWRAAPARPSARRRSRGLVEVLQRGRRRADDHRSCQPPRRAGSGRRARASRRSRGPSPAGPRSRSAPAGAGRRSAPAAPAPARPRRPPRRTSSGPSIAYCVGADRAVAVRDHARVADAGAELAQQRRRRRARWSSRGGRRSVVLSTTLPARPTASISALSSPGRVGSVNWTSKAITLRARPAQWVDHPRVVAAGERPVRPSALVAEVAERRVVDRDDDEAGALARDRCRGSRSARRPSAARHGAACAGRP